jgi:hypothetical protein
VRVSLPRTDVTDELSVSSGGLAPPGNDDFAPLLFASQTKLASHLHDFAVADMNFKIL